MIRNKLAAVAAIGVATAGLTAAVPAPAQAGECTVKLGVTIACGVIKHYSPDTGLDSAIKIRCDYGDPLTAHWLYEGEYSKQYCKDTDRVYVGPGEEIWCNYGTWVPDSTGPGPTGGHVVSDWRKAKPSADPNNPGEYMDATGWYKISNVWDDGAGCTKRAD